MQYTNDLMIMLPFRHMLRKTIPKRRHTYLECIFIRLETRTNRRRKKTNKQNVKRKNIKIIFVRCVEISCHQNNKFCCTSDERSTFCREKILLNEMVEHHLKTENEKR